VTPRDIPARCRRRDVRTDDATRSTATTRPNSGGCTERHSGVKNTFVRRNNTPGATSDVDTRTSR